MVGFRIKYYNWEFIRRTDIAFALKLILIVSKNLRNYFYE